MPRVVVNKKADLQNAAEACPVQCFHKCEDGAMAIDPNECIDCGVCQMQSPEGAIVTDDEASEADKKFNAERALSCPRAV